MPRSNAAGTAQVPFNGVNPAANGYPPNRQFQNRNHSNPNNRFAGPPGMQAGNYHHRNPYSQQPNGNAANVNPNIVDASNAHMNGDAASPNAIVDLYGADEMQQQQQPPVVRSKIQ